MLKLNVDIECVSISGRSGYKSWKELSYSTTYSHVISITALTQKTKSFFSKKMFENFCRGSVFINAGRGQVVDEHSLLEALENNIIKGAILDTHSEFSGDCSKLSYSEHPKVLCTPHIASWSDKFSEIQFSTYETKLSIYTMTDILIIPARAGSVGVKGKNKRCSWVFP